MADPNTRSTGTARLPEASRSRREALLLAAAAALWPLGGTARAAAADAEVGAVHLLVNKAWGTPPGGSERRLERYLPIMRDEALKTGEESATIVRFHDGTDLTMGSNAEITVDEFVYAGPGRGRSVVNLTKGAFRYVSGTMPKENVRLQTPTVTIGIRGTVLKIDVYEDGGTAVSTLDGASTVLSAVTNQLLSMAAGQSVLANAQGLFEGGVRNFIHESLDGFIEQGLGEVRRQSPVPLPSIPIPFP